jgi:hypothetical protein
LRIHVATHRPISDSTHPHLGSINMRKFRAFSAAC